MFFHGIVIVALRPRVACPLHILVYKKDHTIHHTSRHVSALALAPFIMDPHI